MRILHLQLREFGRHRDLDVTLDRGFTIVRGPNESGKSTILRGLEFALFKKPTATGAELDAWHSWGASDDERSWARLEFVVDEEDELTGEIKSCPGVLEKEFRGQKGRVLLDLDGHTVTDPAKADQLLAALTGIPNEAFFRSTASIRHEELANLDRDEGALRDRLAASIGAGDKGSSRAKKRLEDTIRSLKSKGDKNPGRLKIAEETVAQAEAAVRNGEAALGRLERDRDALAQAREARSVADAALVESRNMLDAARQAERLRGEAEAAKERFEKLNQAAQAQEKLREYEAMPERPVAELRATVDKMRLYQSRVAEHQYDLREGLGPEIEPDEKVPPYRIRALLTAVIAILAVATFEFGAQSREMAWMALTAVLVVIGGVLVWNTARVWSDAQTVMKRNHVRENERAIRRQRKVGTEEALRVSQASVQSILRDIGVSDAGLAEEMLAKEQSKRQEMEKLRVQVSALLSNTPPERVDELRQAAALEYDQKTAAIDALGPVATDARARERLEAEVRERQAALERARDAEAGAAARVEANPVDAEQVAGEAERLQVWQDQLAALHRRARIYERTLAAIQLAERQTMRKATRFLEQHVGRDLARLTGGRYRYLQIDDQTLDMTVHAPDKGDWITTAQLSKGTVDQIFLAARIGLVRLVAEGRRPPLILDDPFVTFDDARAARAALLLRELSHDFQVIYLTCSNRYDGLADAVIELPGPTEFEPAAAAEAATVAG